MAGPPGYGHRSADFAGEKFIIPVGDKRCPGQKGHHLRHNRTQVNRGTQDQPLGAFHLFDDGIEIIALDSAVPFLYTVITTIAGFNFLASQGDQFGFNALALDYLQGRVNVLEGIAFSAQATGYA